MDDPVPPKKVCKSKETRCEPTTVDSELESESNRSVDFEIATHSALSSEEVYTCENIASEVSLQSQSSPPSISHTIEKTDEEISSSQPDVPLSELTDATFSQSSATSELCANAAMSDSSSECGNAEFEEFKAQFFQKEDCVENESDKVMCIEETIDNLSQHSSTEETSDSASHTTSSNVSCASQQTAESSITSDQDNANTLFSSESESEAGEICMAFEGSKLTRSAAILKIMKLYFSNSGSKSDFIRTYATMCACFPKVHNMPSSVYMLFKEVLSYSPLNDECSKHYYCSSCVMYQGLESRDECENPTCNETKASFFYHFNLSSVIKSLFEHRNLADAMDCMLPSMHNNNSIKDIVDGLEYKAVNPERGKYDLNVISNSDGVRLRSSSTQELWMLIIMPVEVPPHLRQSYATILSVWCDTPKPNMNAFLKPFADNLQNIWENGVQWTHPKTGEVHLSKVISPLFVADAPARAKIMNMVSFNGKYGCNVCEIKTVRTQRQPGKKRVRVYRYVENVRLREHNRTTLLARLAFEGQTPRKGIKGPCVLVNLPYIKYGKFLFPEYLHSVLLGVTRQVCTLWFEKAGAWNCSAFEVEIDTHLKSIRVPDFFNRLPRPISSRKFWKASEWFNWLIYYSVPLMYSFLGEQFFQHHLLLVSALFRLLQNEISNRDLEESENFLKLYCLLFGELYGDRELTYHVHQLQHLPNSVRDWGPLHFTSAFDFENINGIIADATHGSKNIVTEIVNKINLVQGYLAMQSVEIEESESEYFTKKYFGVGKKAVVPLNEEERSLLLDIGNTENNEMFYLRARIGHEVFTSSTYKQLKTASFYIAWKSNDNSGVGEIRFFGECNDGLFAFVDVRPINQEKVFFHKDTRTPLRNYLPIKENVDSVVLKVRDLQSINKLVRVGDYLCKPPHTRRVVM